MVENTRKLVSIACVANLTLRNGSQKYSDAEFQVF